MATLTRMQKLAHVGSNNQSSQISNPFSRPLMLRQSVRDMLDGSLQKRY